MYVDTVGAPVCLCSNARMKVFEQRQYNLGATYIGSVLLSNSPQKPSPELSATFLSRITWWWLNGLGVVLNKPFAVNECTLHSL